MSKSIKRRINALANGKDGRNMKELFDATLTDLTAIRSILAGLLTASATHDFGSLADGAGESVDVTVTGAVLGDWAVAAIEVDSVDMVVNANVTAANTVTVRVQNESTAVVDLAETTVNVLVVPHGSFAAPSALTLLE